MDIIVQRDALLKPLQALSSIVDKKQTLPLLSNALLTVKEGRLSLTGTDLEIELIGFVPTVSVTTEGSITVSARKLCDICRTLPEGSLLHLALEKKYLSVRAGDSYFMLNTLPPDDFPSLEASVYPVQLALKQALFKNLLTKIYFAMAQQDVRHYLNGAFLDISQQSIKAVAADGHRLAMTTVTHSPYHDINAQVILPRKSVLELIRLLMGEGEEEASLHISEKRFRVVTSDYIFTSKVINAQYPDYNRLIPRGTTVATGDRETIKQVLTRVSILSNERFRGVRFQLTPNKLRITANNSDQEQAEEIVSLHYEGQDMEIGFNVTYLLDAISAITAKSIRCVFTGPTEGVLIESAEEDQSVYVIMPMRL